jgi:uncharacterized Zn finger protein
MALLRVSENSLRAQVPESVFPEALALADHGRVTGLSADGARLSATVDDVVVTVHFTRDGLEATGSCGETSPCAHAVAAALAWVRTGVEESAPDLITVLRGQSVEWLAGRLARLAGHDPALTERLLAEAEQATTDAEQATTVDMLADLRADLESVLADLLAEAEDNGYDDWYHEEWYPDVEPLGEILDEIEDLIEESPDTVRELLERAVDLLEEVFDTQNVYGGELLDELGRVESMHLAACLAGSPDPVRLAEWLIGKALTSGWCDFERSVGDYAPALGDQGLIRCHELLAAPAVQRHLGYKLSEALESLARAEGGTDAVVAFLAQHASNSQDIAKIAGVLIADGRDDDALLWIGRGLRDYRPVSQRLLDLALGCHERAGRDDLALRTRWEMFTHSPDLHTYLALTKQAGPDKATWSAQATAHLRAETHLAPVLTDVLLHEGDTAGAWEIFGATGGALGHDLRMRVVNARAVTHPQDVIPIYRELAETNVSRASRPGYQDAIQHLRVVRTMSERAGTIDDFTAYLDRLRADHPGKKAFHQELDRARLS